MTDPTPTPDPTFAEYLKNVPGYVLNYTVGFLLGILSDITLTSLTLASVFLGLATNVFVGLSAFFLLHVVIRMVNAVTQSVALHARVISRAGHRLTSIFESQLPSEPGKDGPPVA